MNKKEVGKIIRKKRREKDISQSELGEIFGKTKDAICKWEKGINEPTVTVLIQLEKELGVMTAILEKMKEDEPKPEKN